MCVEKKQSVMKLSISCNPDILKSCLGKTALLGLAFTLHQLNLRRKSLNSLWSIQNWIATPCRTPADGRSERGHRRHRISSAPTWSSAGYVLPTPRLSGDFMPAFPCWHCL